MNEHALESAAMTWQLSPGESSESTTVTLTGNLVCQCGKVMDLPSVCERLSFEAARDLIRASMSAAALALILQAEGVPLSESYIG
jgi:hypothetical protein